MLRLSEVLEPWRRPPFCPYLLPLRFCFFSRVSLRRLCFSMPTRSSSTLCWIPEEVSMNFESRDAANDFPSVESKTKLFIYFFFNLFFPIPGFNFFSIFMNSLSLSYSHFKIRIKLDSLF